MCVLAFTAFCFVCTYYVYVLFRLCIFSDAFFFSVLPPSDNSYAVNNNNNNNNYYCNKSLPI
jgi:hypothetical protein